MPVIAISGALRFPAAAFAVASNADWWWGRLRQACPTALAVVVVPDGFELVAAVAEPEHAFARVLSHAAELGDRLQSASRMWRPIASPRCTSDGPQISRWIEDTLRLPCARGLVADPMRWRWSTLRDLAGLVCDPWVEPHFVDAVLATRGQPPPPCIDAWVNRGGWRPSLATVPPLAAVARAAAEATREHPSLIARAGATRNVFVWLALAHGCHDLGRLAACCGTDEVTVRGIATRPNPQWLAAAQRALADPRLKEGSTVAPKVA